MYQNFGKIHILNGWKIFSHGVYPGRLFGGEIPVWYGEDGKIFVAEDEKEAIEAAKNYYKKDNIKLGKETDVLDTLFSSSLWPLSSLSWPIDLQNEYYPTSVLVTVLT